MRFFSVTFVGVITICVCLSVGAVVANAAPRRFIGQAVNYAGGGGEQLGPSHEGWVGDGGIRVRFLDRMAANTKYKVCWTRAEGANPSGCKYGATGSKGVWSMKLLNDPGGIDKYEIRWWVGKTLAARWLMTWNIGD